MNITISACWVYGWPAYDIGKCVYDNEAKRSKFYWQDMVYDSPWLACNALSESLRRVQKLQNPEYGGRIFAGSVGGESMIGIKIDAEIGRINSVPENLEETKKHMLEIMRQVGFSDLPGPKLYFIVDVDD